MSRPRDTRNDPLARVFPPFAHKVAPGGIEEQEAEGGAAMQAGDCEVIPVKGAADEDLVALGFKLGPVNERDPLFREATLPPEWKRQGTGHSMWTRIVDEHGRERVSMFYKAAYYDRRASLQLIGVSGYVRKAIDEGSSLILDDTWATRDAVLEAIGAAREYATEHLEFWTEHSNTEYADQHREELKRCDALEAALPGDGDR